MIGMEGYKPDIDEVRDRIEELEWIVNSYTADDLSSAGAVAMLEYDAEMLDFHKALLAKMEAEDNA